MIQAMVEDWDSDNRSRTTMEISPFRGVQAAQLISNQ